MSEDCKSDSSTSESEVSACSSNYNPLKALYSNKAKIPVESAPMFENIAHFEAAQSKSNEVIPFGHAKLVKKREEEKEKKRLEEERLLEEKNKRRFAKYETVMVPTKEYRARNLLTRIEAMEGPLGVLKDCVDNRLRVKIITRSHSGVRGVLHATLVAFDKHWNMALSDVLEIWKRKRIKQRKIPPIMGKPVPKGTAATISSIPVVTETPIGKGIFECKRYVPQMMMRGEHIVLINVVDR